MANLRPPLLKRTLNVGIATLVAFSFWSGSLRATASCGDYLIPMGQSTMGQSIQGHVDQLTASSERDVQHVEQSKVPCSGPHCGQAPPNDQAMTVVAVPPRDHQPVTLLTGSLETAELPLAHDWDVSRLDAKEFLENGGLFRPPRLIAE